MEACSLEELKEHFEAKIERLTRCMDLAAEVIGLGAPVTKCREQLIAVNSELCLAESAVGQLREHVKIQRQQVEEAKVAMENELVNHVKYTVTHLPDRLPSLQKPQQNSNQVEQSNHRIPLIPRQASNHDINHERPPSATDKKSTGFKKQHYVPQMEILTIDEFNSVPKYMKGRLSYNIINSMVDGINLTLTTKYDLMHKVPSKLTEAKRKKYHKFKEQENKNTKGVFFFIDDDFKNYSKLKYDNTARSIITILRHVGRLREIRGGGVTRFAVI
ncbi:SKA complex subunit 1-like [Amphiura filiformis]|uniref:SKA complex subunit 1-like n=1 Tax=Amphiura filiformis TaxID=82378 RepID=UPI003B225704